MPCGVSGLVRTLSKLFGRRFSLPLMTEPQENLSHYMDDLSLVDCPLVRRFQYMAMDQLQRRWRVSPRVPVTLDFHWVHRLRVYCRPQPDRGSYVLMRQR